MEDLELSTDTWWLPEMSRPVAENFIKPWGSNRVDINKGTSQRLKTQIMTGWNLKEDEKNPQHRAFGKPVLF